MKSISSAVLVSLISSTKSGEFIRVTTFSDVKIPAKYGLSEVKRYATLSAQVGCSYENSVNRRLNQSGNASTFKTESLPWGKWFIPNRIIEHKDKFYARLYRTANSNAEVAYYVGDRLATPDETAIIVKYDASFYGTFSAKQSNEGLTTHQVSVYNPKIEDIIFVSADKGNYYHEENKYQLAWEQKDSVAR